MYHDLITGNALHNRADALSYFFCQQVFGQHYHVLEKALFGAVATVSPHGELEGLEGDQVEGTVQGGLEDATDPGLHRHP